MDLTLKSKVLEHWAHCLLLPVHKVRQQPQEAEAWELRVTVTSKVLSILEEKNWGEGKYVAQFVKKLNIKNSTICIIIN